MKTGKLVISLDFELLWGELDLPEKDSYRENIVGGRNAITKILDLFAKHRIHATWATVGIIALKNKDDLMNTLPQKQPQFKNRKCSAYEHLDEIGFDEIEDPYSFAPSLVTRILQYEGQEIGSHTFSHYYCNEDGADVESFREDIKTAVSSMKRDYGIEIKSLVFPRNQAKKEFVDAALEEGICCWRGNPPIGYRVSNNKLTQLFDRIVRLLDSYFPVLGDLCVEPNEEIQKGCCTASRFFRPYNRKLMALEGLKLHRIKKQMLYAAKNKKSFHIWWHPHNFGKDTDIMLDQLEDILNYYDVLHNNYQFQSINMGEYVK